MNYSDFLLDLCLLLFLNLFLNSFFFFFLNLRSPFIHIILPIIIITRMIFLKFFSIKIIVIYLPPRTLARFPRPRQWRLKPLLSNIKQSLILFHIHTQIPSILLYFLSCRFIVFVKFFLKYFKAFLDQSFTSCACT